MSLKAGLMVLWIIITTLFLRGCTVFDVYNKEYDTPQTEIVLSETAVVPSSQSDKLPDKVPDDSEEWGGGIMGI
ncbi:MAG: hypothetical protein J6K55_12845 [Clostridia bacterium]|nr:hypothetical protein [Clostridia bacterium]